MKIYSIDASGRLCLGKEFANKMLSLKIRQGNIELVPVQVILEKEAWLYKSPEAFAVVRQELEQAKEGKGKSLNFSLEKDDEWLEAIEKQVKGRAG